MEDFLSELAAPTPTPGGGAAACQTAAMAAALGEMVTGLGAQKNGGQDDLLRDLAGARRELLATAVADARSFDAVMSVLREPKDAPGRRDRLADALRGAALVPLAAMDQMASLVGLLKRAGDVAPKSALSDYEASLILIRAAREIARKNVVVNLTGAMGRDDLVKRLAASDVAFETAMRSV